MNEITICTPTRRRQIVAFVQHGALLMGVIVGADVARRAELHVHAMCRGHHQSSESRQIWVERLGQPYVRSVAEEVEKQDGDPGDHHQDRIEPTMNPVRAPQADAADQERDRDHHDLERAVRQKADAEHRQKRECEGERHAMDRADRGGGHPQPVEYSIGR